MAGGFKGVYEGWVWKDKGGFEGRKLRRTNPKPKQCGKRPPTEMDFRCLESGSHGESF